MNFRLVPVFDLTGHTALVTGGSSGIGLAMARALGLGGAKVVLLARRIAELERAKAALADDEISVAVVAADLASRDAGPRVASAMAELDLVIDILVNVAGVNLREPFCEVSTDAFDLHMALHLRAPFLLTQVFAPAMASKRWGRIINIASLQSWRAFPNSAPYGAAKGGVLQLTRAIAEEWSRHGITCNAIAPWFFPDAAHRSGFWRFRTCAQARGTDGDRPQRRSRRFDGCDRVSCVRRVSLCDRPDTCGRWRVHREIRRCDASSRIYRSERP